MELVKINHSYRINHLLIDDFPITAVHKYSICFAYRGSEHVLGLGLYKSHTDVKYSRTSNATAYKNS